MPELIFPGGVGPGTAGTTELIKRIRRRLDNAPYQAITNGAINTTGVESSYALALASGEGTKWAVGNVVEFQDTGEQLLVLSISGDTLTLRSQHNGTSTLAGLHPSGTVIFKNPVWSYARLLEEIASVLDTDLWPWVYTYADQTITAASLQVSPRPYWFNLETADMALISVHQLSATTPTRVISYGTKGSGLPVAFKKNLPSALAASGTGLYLPRVYNTTQDIAVRKARKITSSTIPDGPEAEVIELAVLARLLRSRDIKRHTEDSTMGQRSAPPGSSSRTALFYERELNTARQRVKLELMTRLPLMRRW